MRRRHVSAATTHNRISMCSDTASRLTAGAVPRRRFLALCNGFLMLNGSAGAPLPVLGPRAALRSGRLALDDLRPAVAGTGTGRGSAGTGRAAAASHVTFRSGRSASLRCSQRRSPGKATDGPGQSDNCGGYSGYSGDIAVDNVSSPKPRTRRGYSEDTQIRAGDNGGTARVLVDLPRDSP